MERAEWTRRFELCGEERIAALKRIAAAVEAWGLSLPGDPMPIHFGLNDFERIGETEFWIVNDTENSYCGKFLFLFEGQTCPRHHHRIKHETFFIVKGAVSLATGESERRLAAGDTLPVAPGVSHHFTAVDGPALVLEVSLPSIPGDSIFEDTRIGDAGVL
jgi:N-acetylneuraminate synthase